MERTLIKDLAQLVGKEVSVSGRILNMRVLSGKTFVVFQDYTGVVQAVFASEPALKIGEAAVSAGRTPEWRGPQQAR
jgi:aspartyl/asparaginyl-tRNA synthetase